MSDIHATARDGYRLKVELGEQPLVMSGGQLDGLPYSEVELDGHPYLLTDVGLFDPLPGPADEE